MGKAALIDTVRVIVGSGSKVSTTQVEAAVKLARMGDVDRNTRRRQHVTYICDVKTDVKSDYGRLETMTIGRKNLFPKSSLRF